jgi:hypothetical protein
LTSDDDDPDRGGGNRVTTVLTVAVTLFTVSAILLTLFGVIDW